jgi:hypothetical protein
LAQIVTPVSEWGRLVDEHDGNIVADCVTQATILTDQNFFALAVFELTLAFRTHEDFEQLG